MIPKNPFVEEIRTVTGIDVGSTAIKMVTMRKNAEGRPEILKISKSLLPKTETSKDPADYRSKLVRALRSAKEAHGIPLGVVSIALSRERAIMRYLNLPSITPEEVKEMLMFDVERHVPFPIDKIQLDHSIVEQLEDHSIVNLAAVSLEEVEELVGVFESAGIQVKIVDIDVLAACASYTYDRQDMTPVRAILDIGRSHADLGVLVDKTVRFSRSTTIGENKGREQSDPSEDEDAFSPHRSVWVHDLSKELNRLIKAYECEPDHEEIKEVVLCGGGAKIRGLEQELSKSLGRRVRAVPPELYGIIGVDGVTDGDMTVALGLALRSLDKPEINLLPAPVITRREKAENRRISRNIAIYVGILFFLICGIVGEKFQAKYAYRNRLLAAKAVIDPKIKDIRKKKEKLDEIRANVDSEHSFYQVLQDLYTRTPEHVTYLSIVFEKKAQLALRGQLPTDKDYLNLVNVLKESPHFRDVVPASYKWVTTYNKVNVREFETTNCILQTNEDYHRRRESRGGKR